MIQENLFMGGFTVWDILGVTILLGPLIAVALSLTSAFLYTGYRDLFNKQPRYSARAVALISVSLGIVTITGVGYTYLRPVYFQPGVIEPSGVLTAEGEVDFNVSWDPEGMIEAKEIDWGTLQPGETASKTLYIISQSSEPVYFSVTWNESSWFPDNAVQFFELRSGSSGGSLQPYQSLPVLIELSVSPRVSGISSFSFDIVVKAGREPFN